MAYTDLALLAGDTDFSTRVAACVASETVANPDVGYADPFTWARDHTWKVAAQPGFADAYASALASSNPRPGWDASVITDAQILSAVQAIVASEAPAEEPEPEPEPTP